MFLPLKIENINAADLDQVMAIEIDNYEHPWPKSFFLNDLASTQSICLGGWLDDNLVCYATAMCAGIEMHITNVSVKKNYQRKGLGSHMMNILEKAGKERGCAYAYLEVRTSNTPALEMYKRLGYNVAYTRRRYYLDGEDAYVMEKMF